MSDTQMIKLFLENRRDLFDKLLAQLENNEQPFSRRELEELLSMSYPFRWIYEDNVVNLLHQINDKIDSQKFACRFSKEDEGMMRMLVSASQSPEELKASRDSGLREIRDFTRDAESLIIIDPYIFSGESIKAQDYIDDFKRSSRIDKS